MAEYGTLVGILLTLVYHRNNIVYTPIVLFNIDQLVFTGVTRDKAMIIAMMFYEAMS